MTGSEKPRALITGATSGTNGVGAIIWQNPADHFNQDCLPFI